MHEMLFILGGHSPSPILGPFRGVIFPSDLRDNKVWPSSLSERRQHRRIATRSLTSLEMSDVFRLWTDKENSLYRGINQENENSQIDVQGEIWPKMKK